MKISASIIVFNEEANIADLCETVSFCDEIVIVDSSSSDKTIEIARRYTDKIFQHEFRGYKDKHEFADAQTTGDWILWIDADERITPELRRSIENLKTRNEKDLPDGFRIARKTFYLGNGSNSPVGIPIIKCDFTGKARVFGTGVSPHETARVKGRVDKLDGEFLHYTKNSLSEHHRVTDNYTTLAAEYKVKQGEKVATAGIFFNSIAAFVRTYILKQGFRDGVQGLIIAMFTAYSVFLKYAKVREKNNVK